MVYFNKTIQGEGVTIWFTGIILACSGLPSSGKTTLGKELEKLYLSQNKRTILLDGDCLRTGLNSDLNFSKESRTENVRRTAEVAKLFNQQGFITIVTLISPHDKSKFFLVHLETSLDVCEKRDVKGLYKLAREGKIKEMTGIESVFERPGTAEIVIDTDVLSISDSVRVIDDFLKNNISHLSPQIIELFAHAHHVPPLLDHAKKLPKISLTKIQLQWLQVLSEGWASPLKGFMREVQLLQCLHFSMIKGSVRNHSEIDESWHLMPLPILLGISKEKSSELLSSNFTDVSLVYENKIMAILQNIEIYPFKKSEILSRKFVSTSSKHPYNNYINDENLYIGGELVVMERIRWNDGLDRFRLTPNEIRHRLKANSHDVMFAFQLRNPIHNGHALLMKNTFHSLIDQGYKNPVLLLHPLGGEVKDDDVPLHIRIKQHEAVLEDRVLDLEHTILAIFPSPMCYAGPTEVQWHCRTRMICGANYYIVGRDPAGIPDPEDSSQNLFDATHGGKVLVNAPLLESLRIVPFTTVAYHIKNKKMEEVDIVHKDEYDFISGTRMRKIARDGLDPPEGFMSPKAWKIIKEYYQSLQ